MADLLSVDGNGNPSLGGMSDTDAAVVGIQADDTSKSLRINNWVWNTSTLQWERMKQPVLELSGDLTVTMGDVEALLAENYWKAKRYDWNGTTGNLDYRGVNTSATAAEGAATWYVWKYTWDASGRPTLVQGPLVGSWTGRAALGW